MGCLLTLPLYPITQVAKVCEGANGRSGWVRTETCDLMDPASIDALAGKVKEQGGLDILVCNAGTSQGNSKVLEGSPDDWDVTVNVNVLAPMRLTRLLAPEIVKKGHGRGAVIFTGSLAGYRPMQNSAYSASKYAIKGWALACYEELSREGVKVSVLEPGFVNTPMVEQVKGDHSLMIQPEDLAEAALLPFRTGKGAPVEVVLRLGRSIE